VIIGPSGQLITSQQACSAALASLPVSLAVARPAVGLVAARWAAAAAAAANRPHPGRGAWLGA